MPNISYIVPLENQTVIIKFMYLLSVQGTMRSDMHGMYLSVQSDETCRTLEQYNPKDMLCVKGRPPRYDSACNVSCIDRFWFPYSSAF